MKAIIILSGGLDSTVLLAKAIEDKRDCIALSFDYQQRHICELKAAEAIAKHYGIPQKVIQIPPSIFDHSSLVNDAEVPKNRDSDSILKGGIPNTYVPARNTLFLSFATGFAEITEADEIHFGANSMDSIGYPDTRPEYLSAFQALISLATKRAVEGNPPALVTPLIHLDKAGIIREGVRANAPLHLTLSCYDPPEENLHCGFCDACILRKEGFLAAGVKDPTTWAKKK